jgi:hypothetical protein
LTGYCPYEETLKDIHCPRYLLNSLSKAWESDEVIREVIETLDSSDNSCTQYKVLADTIYRYLVLFSSSPSFKTGFLENKIYQDSKVWMTLVQSLGLKGVEKGGKGKNQCRLQFSQDKDEWCFHSGRNETIVR